MYTFVPFSSWAPDTPSYHDPAVGQVTFSRNVENVIPREAMSGSGGAQAVTFGPCPSLSPFTDALDARCQGAFAILSDEETPYVLAGDATKLYELLTSGPTWTDVTGPNGYGIVEEDWWSFTSYGDQVFAVNQADPIQQLTVDVDLVFSDLAAGNILTISLVAGTGYTDGVDYPLSAVGDGSGYAGLVDVVGGSFTNLRTTNPGRYYTTIPTIALPVGAGAGDGNASITVTGIQTSIAPRAHYCATVRDFLVLGNTVDAVSGTRQQRVWWSAIGRPDYWPTPGTLDAQQVLSDFQDIVGIHGELKGIVPKAGNVDAVLFFERAIYVMNFSGPPAIFQITPVENARGTPAPKSMVPVGRLIYYLGDNGFYVFDGNTSQPIGYERVDKTFFATVSAANLNNVIGTYDIVNKMVIWTFPSGNAVNGICDSALIYKPEINEWSKIVGMTTEYMFQSITFGISLEELAIKYPDIEDVPYSFDSPVWAGNQWVVGGFDNLHQMNYFSGPNLPPVVETGTFVIGDGAKISLATRAAIMNSRPVFEGPNATAQVSIGYRNTLNQNLSYSPLVSTNENGECPQRVSGRYFTARQTIDGVWNHLVGVEVVARADGKR